MEYAEEVDFNNQLNTDLFEDSCDSSDNYDNNDVFHTHCDQTKSPPLIENKTTANYENFAEFETKSIGKDSFMTLEEFKSLRAKYLIQEDRKCFESVNIECCSEIAYAEAEISPIKSSKATMFFTSDKKRYPIDIIISFLDLSLEYCFISKKTYKELLCPSKKSLEKKIKKQLKEIKSKYMKYEANYKSLSDDIIGNIDIQSAIAHLKSKFKGLDYLLSLKRFVYLVNNKYPQLFFPNTGAFTEFEKNSLGHRNDVYHYVGQKMLKSIEVQFLNMLNVNKNSSFMFVRLESDAFMPFKCLIKKLILLTITDQFISIRAFKILEEGFVENGQNLRFLELSKIKSDVNGFHLGGLQYLKNLSTLFLEQNELTEKQVDGILRQIMSLKSLSALSLSKNKVKTITPFFSFFIKNCNLKTLYFEKNLVSDNGSNNIEEFFLLSKCLAKNKTITHLRVNQVHFRLRHLDELHNFFDNISFFDDQISNFYIRNPSKIFESEKENVVESLSM